MKNKKLIIVFFIVLIGGIIITYISQKENNSKDNTENENLKSKTPEIEEISTDFNLNTFTGLDEEKLLKEINICDSTMKADNNLARPSCSPRFFRFFKLKAEKSLKDGFILLVRSGVNGFPVRRLLVFERAGKRLINTNKFIGYIIEKRKIDNNNDDILIRFFERYQNQKYFYHCLYSWKNGKYEFVRCEEINSERVKPEYIDSVSIEVHKILYEKSLEY